MGLPSCILEHGDEGLFIFGRRLHNLSLAETGPRCEPKEVDTPGGGREKGQEPAPASSQSSSLT